jgi:hypothetical protein
LPVIVVLLVTYSIQELPPMAELEASIPVFGADGERKCSALSLVDMQRCQATATSINGLFCSLHAKQCHGK